VNTKNFDFFEIYMIVIFFDLVHLFNLPEKAHKIYEERVKVNITPQKKENREREKREKRTFGPSSARRSILKNILDAM
jgi:hypothetical protein